MTEDNPIFFNTDIFTNEGDFVIGGFRMNGKTEIKYADVYFALFDRIQNLIDEYIERYISSTAKFDEDSAKKNNALKEIKQLIKDYLSIDITSSGYDEMPKVIIETPQIVRWLSDVKDRLNYELTKIQAGAGVKNGTGSVQMNYSIAEEFTKNTTLEDFLQQISQIEL
jgi:hypothetical protein